MGLNVRTGDVHSELATRITESREAREEAVRAKVRSGEISLDQYLTGYKGYSPAHAAMVAAAFSAAIFGV